MMLHCLQPFCKNPTSLLGSISSTFMHGFITKPFNETRQHNYGERTKELCRKKARRRTIIANGFLFPMDVDSESIASQLFAFSLLPYLGFLYFITKSKSAPKLTLFGFYFLLVFVGATVPASIYAKVHYGTCLSNIDWLHDGAESLLILTNIFIVLGLRGAIRDAKYVKERTSNLALGIKDADKSST